MWTFSVLILICRRTHAFCLILSMAVKLQKNCGEIGAFYNRASEITFAHYCYKFNNILMSLLLLIFSWEFYWLHIKTFHYPFIFTDFLFFFNTAVDIFSQYKLKCWYRTKSRTEARYWLMFLSVSFEFEQRCIT